MSSHIFVLIVVVVVAVVVIVVAVVAVVVVVVAQQHLVALNLGWLLLNVLPWALG